MIRLKTVSKIYDGDKPALVEVNVAVTKGEFVFLVGPSGSGKSTFIRLLLREFLPTRGDIFVAGQDIVHMRHWKVPYLRRNIGCVFQDFKLPPHRTPFENVGFALQVTAPPRCGCHSQVPEVL